jgi:hypothetical protein
MTRFKAIGFLIAIVACALVGCAAPLLNSNTLDLAATVDDLIVRQIVFNLTKIKDNEFALPAQVQIVNGQVSATLSVTPSIASPLNSALSSTSQIVTGSTNTLTRINTNNVSNASASVSGTAATTQDWVVNPVQDPEQLRRLRLLYQYATGYISQYDLVCSYPIPQKPEKTDTQNSDLKALADALKSERSPAPPHRAPATRESPTDKDKPCINKSTSDKSSTDKSSTDKLPNDKPARSCTYVRAERCDHPGPEHRFWTSIGPNPDPAFLNSPGCVLCAYPNRKFQKNFTNNTRIYPNLVSDDFQTYREDRQEIVEVVLNRDLMPNDTSRYIDWLDVLKDGAEPRQNSRRIGSANGYTVYAYPRVSESDNEATREKSGDARFYEFVLAIIEATLQNPEIQKAAAPAPPVTQSLR